MRVNWISCFILCVFVAGITSTNVGHNARPSAVNQASLLAQMIEDLRHVYNSHGNLQSRRDAKEMLVDTRSEPSSMYTTLLVYSKTLVLNNFWIVILIWAKYQVVEEKLEKRHEHYYVVCTRKRVIYTMFIPERTIFTFG